MAYGDAPIKIDFPPPPVGTTLTPTEEREMQPDPADKTVHVPTPAGVDRQKAPSTATAMAAQGRGWGPNEVIPYWDLNKAIQITAFTFGVGMLMACVVHAFGSLFGVFPAGREREYTQREVDELVDQAADAAVERAFTRMQREGWHR